MAMDAFPVIFFDLCGLVYAPPRIHGACALVERRKLKENASARDLSALRLCWNLRSAGTYDQHHKTMMLVAKDTGHMVAISPASSHYGVI